ncbi:hypothetical protein Gohar_019729, partial [Gossypium harknessii]|nr:hypothetical protein [Gossypium harknessii]
MTNKFLDKVEDNAIVRIWSERVQLEKGDSLAKDYVSKLWDYTRISVTQNSLQELKEIWDTWNDETKQLFYSNYGDLLYLLDVKVDERLFRALAQYWNPAIKQKGECKCIPWKNLQDLILAHLDMKKKVDVFALRVTLVPAILAETFRSLNACRRAGEGRFIGCAQLLVAWFHSHFWKVDKISYRVFSEHYSPLKEIVATPRRDDISEENWIAILQNLQDFDWVPLLGIWGAVGYAPLLVLRQYNSRQFVPATHGLAQCEFSYRGDNYKKKVKEISQTWNQVHRMKRLAVGSMTTLEYGEWRSKRINDNIPKLNSEGVRPMEEYLQVIPS